MDNNLKKKCFLVVWMIFGVVSFGCRGMLSFSSQDDSAITTVPVGFEFAGGGFQSLEGDHGAPDHLFLHKYPMPSEGVITGMIFLADSDEVPEIISVLILRPVDEGWKIIHNVPIPDDDLPAKKRGLVTYTFKAAFPVNEGDIFAHWQPGARPTGPIPLNVDETSLEGRSSGKAGFNKSDLEVGLIVSERGFTGARDYAVNLIFLPDSSP
mgnify:CR=1 FL=1